MRGGIADSATGRRFSRSPLIERRQHRRVERHAARSAWLPSSSRSTRSGDRGGGLRAGRCGLRGRRRLLEDDADQLALELRRARHDRDRAGADRELAGLLGVRALRVAEVVQPIDELALGQRLAAAELERPREDARQHACRARRAAARRSAARS